MGLVKTRNAHISPIRAALWNSRPIQIHSGSSSARGTQWMAREIEKAGRRFFLGMMLVVFASKIGAAQTLDPRPLVSSSSADHHATDSIGQLLSGSPDR